MPQRAAQIGISESIAGFQQAGWQHSRTGQHGSTGHLSQGQAEQRRRHRNYGRPGQSSSQGLCEITVGHGLRSRQVYWSSQRLIGDSMLDGSDDIVHCDPAHPLPSAAQATSQSQAEGQEHPPEGAAARTQDNPESRVHDSYSCLTSRLRSAFPVLGNFRQEFMGPQSAVFGENLIPAIAIHSHSGGCYQHLGFDPEPAERFTQRSGAEGTAGLYPPLPFGSPSGSYILTGQMDDPIQHTHSLWMEQT
jgi:hypothetical protein